MGTEVVAESECPQQRDGEYNLLSLEPTCL